MTRSRPRKLYIPLTFALRAWRHAAEDEPLLRERRESDVHTLLALRDDDGFNLGFEEWDEEVSAIETFRDLATFLGLSPENLLAVCEARGANVLLPDAEDVDDPIPNPYEYLEKLADLAPVPSLDEKLRRLPRRFSLSPEDRRKIPKHPGLMLPTVLGRTRPYRRLPTRRRGALLERPRRHVSLMPSVDAG